MKEQKNSPRREEIERKKKEEMDERPKILYQHTSPSAARAVQVSKLSKIERNQTSLKDAAGSSRSPTERNRSPLASKMALKANLRSGALRDATKTGSSFGTGMIAGLAPKIIR